MLIAEIAAWSRAADGLTTEAVGTAGIEAYEEWLFQIGQPREHHDLSSFAGDCHITPRLAAETAGDAAVELAIICCLWPLSLDTVFRRGVAPRG